MKQFNNRICLLMLLCMSITTALQAQNFDLIDVNTSKDADPVNYQQSNGKSQFAVLRHVAYFAADDGIHGKELWCSDGALGGTKLVKDINPGNASSDIQNIISSGGKIYFSAKDDKNGQEIWVSDGTKEGTKLVKDIYAGPANSNPSYLTDVNDTVYFFTKENFSSDKLWKTDGTKEGTKLVANFNTAGFMYASNPQYTINVNGRLFFRLFTSTYGYELWTSDGAKDGTRMVADINPNGAYAGSYPSNFTLLNGLLYFAADDGTGGYQLYVSDGTTAGTHRINNSDTIYISSREIPFAIKNNVLYFEGGNSSFGFYELCKYDPSDADNNVELVKDINRGVDPSYPYNITNIGGTLFFTAFDGSVQGLWKTDGTKAGTQLIYNKPGSYLYNQFINYKGQLLYSFYDDENGWELWKSDGTTKGTKVVKNIFPGIYSSVPNHFTDIGSDIVFSAINEINGIELWRTNGTPGGTTIVKDINQTSTSSSYPGWLTPMQNNKILFSASNNKYGGGELWKSDGTTAGTQLIKDLVPGLDGANAAYFTNLNDVTYFFAYSGGFYRLWKTDGTKAGTSAIPIPAFDNGEGYVQSMTATNNLLYILTFNYTNFEPELWRSDGTPAGTFIVKSFAAFYSTEIHALGNTLFFSNYDDTYGYELWKTDGTVAGTGLVKDIFPGSESSWPQNFITYNGKLYFAAYDISFSFHVWTSDGTEEGTKIISEKVNAYGEFTVANGKLFFYGYTYELGAELYVTDGTGKGTKLVKDIYPGYNDSYYNLPFPPPNLTAGTDSLFYFIADNGSYGYELWKSNGTKGGTRLVKDITPGSVGSNLSNFTIVAGQLYFLNNGILWTSDGSKDGTFAISDPTLGDVTQISNLIATKNKLYFTGYTYPAGYELYAGSAATSFAPAEMIAKNTSVIPGNNIEARLKTNPFINQLQFTVNVKDQQAVQVIIMDASGKILKSEKRTLSAGTNVFAYDTNAWMRGMYMVRIITADGNSSLLKAVK